MTIEMVLLALIALAGGTLIGWSLRQFFEIGCGDWVEPTWARWNKPNAEGTAPAASSAKRDASAAVGAGAAAAGASGATAAAGTSSGAGRSAERTAFSGATSTTADAPAKGVVEMLPPQMLTSEVAGAPSSSTAARSGSIESSLVAESATLAAGGEPGADAEIAAADGEIERLRIRLGNAAKGVPAADITGLDPEAALAAKRAEASALRLALWSNDASDEDGLSLDAPVIPPAQLSAEEAEAQAFFVDGAAPAPAPAFLTPEEPGTEPGELTRIGGFGPRYAARADAVGVRGYEQMASMSGGDLAWLDQSVRANGDSVRDRWLPQAQEMARRKAALAAPMSDDEQEAQRLIDAGILTAADANRPAMLLDTASEGPADDLRKISGIGSGIEERLNDQGVWYYRQLAEMDGADIAWVDAKLPGFNGRILRDRWVPQAQMLSAAAMAGPMSDNEREAAWLIASGTFEATEANRPAMLTDTASDGAADDLTRISGVGPKMSDTLNENGVHYFRQLGAFEAQDIAWMDTKLTGFRGRIVRDRWVPQARGLAAEALVGPMSDEEREASRLIASGEFEATAANRPVMLTDTASDGAADDLTRINGIGPKMSGMLNDNGVHYFRQLGAFEAQDIAWMDTKLTGFRGRIVRDRWVPQARGLAEESDGGPMSAEEAEAARLIESGAFDTSDAARPDELLDAPNAGAADDLKRIKGVGPKLEGVLNDLGVYYFEQIASFEARDIAWVDARLKFKGRIIRDRWVPQARDFAAEKARG